MKMTLRKPVSILLLTLMLLSTITAVLPEKSFAAGTTLPDGTYNLDADAYTFTGGTGKAKLNCSTVIVKNGEATAVFEATSENMTHLYMGSVSNNTEDTSLYDPSTDKCGADVYAITNKQVTVPVTLNKEMPVAARTTAMTEPHWVQYHYTITLSDGSSGDSGNEDQGKDDQTSDDHSSDDQSGDKDPSGDGSGNQPTDDDATYTDFTFTNNTAMFKLVKAQLKTSSGKKSLIVALSANGYENLYKGTFDAALANGLNKSNWIHGYKNSDDKWEFEIPLDGDETRIPVVSISKTHLEKVEAGTEKIEECMYYRLLEVDYSKKTVTSGDYYEVNDVAVTNNISGLAMSAAATLKTTGSVSSNNYSNLLTLTMTSTDFDIIKANKYSNYGGEIKVLDPVEIKLGADGKFAEIPVINGEQTVELHSKVEDKWYSVTLTVDLANKKASLAGSVGKEEQKADDKEDAKDNSEQIAKVKKAAVKGFKVKATKKKMTVTWKANKKVFSGYQISYKLGKKTKTVLVKKASIAKKVIKKLKSKKKYTVKIRGFKKLDGQTIYGKWSKAKKVKIK